MGGLTGIHARDTIDATDLYIRTANAIAPDTAAIVPGSLAMYTLGSGPGPGAPVVWVISPSTWRRVDPRENHPSGPAPRAVGCYDVTYGPWSGGGPERDVLPLPDDLALHWQYDWRFGRETHLVATDGNGEVLFPYRLATWQPRGGDSIRVVLSREYQALEYSLGAERRGYRGSVSIGGHARVIPSPRPDPAASVVMRRVPCSGQGDQPIR